MLVPFPFTDLSGQKVRPALVLAAPARSEDFIVAFISSVQAGHSAYALALRPSKQNGLKTASRLRLDKLATLEKSVSLGAIGTLEPALLTAAEKKLRALFNL